MRESTLRVWWVAMLSHDVRIGGYLPVMRG